MRVLCMLRFCRYGPWRKIETSAIEADGEWVRESKFQRRECRYCGRRQERKLSTEWDGYYMTPEPNPPEKNSD